MCPGPPPSVTCTNPLTQTLKCHLTDSLASTFFPLPLEGPQNQQGKLVANGNGLGSKVRPSSPLQRAGGKFSRASGAPFHQSRWPLPCLGLSFLFYKKQAPPSLILLVKLRRVTGIQPTGAGGLGGMLVGFRWVSKCCF